MENQFHILHIIFSLLSLYYLIESSISISDWRDSVYSVPTTTPYEQVTAPRPKKKTNFNKSPTLIFAHPFTCRIIARQDDIHILSWITSDRSLNAITSEPIRTWTTIFLFDGSKIIVGDRNGTVKRSWLKANLNDNRKTFVYDRFLRC